MSGYHTVMLIIAQFGCMACGDAGNGSICLYGSLRCWWWLEMSVWLVLMMVMARYAWIAHGDAGDGLICLCSSWWC